MGVGSNPWSNQSQQSPQPQNFFLNGLLPPIRGGTGVAAVPEDGQILIGKSAGHQFVLGTLTAGAGITITNGAGTIEIASTGGGGGLDYVIAGDGAQPPSPLNDGFGNFIYIPYTP